MDVTLLETAKTFLQVFTTLDPNTIAAVQGEKYRHTFAPASVEGLPPLDREQFAAHLTHMRKILKSFPVTAKQIWSNPLNSQVTIWADSVTHFHDHVKDNDNEEEWLYRGEYIFILTMDPSGRKIEHVLEFIDSKGTDRVRGLLVRAQAKLQSQQEGS